MSSSLTHAGTVVELILCERPQLQWVPENKNPVVSRSQFHSGSPEPLTLTILPFHLLRGFLDLFFSFHFFLLLLLHLFIPLLCICGHTRCMVFVWRSEGSLVRIGSLLLPCRFQRLNLGSQARQQGHLPSDPSCRLNPRFLQHKLVFYPLLWIFWFCRLVLGIQMFLLVGHFWFYDRVLLFQGH